MTLFKQMCSDFWCGL